MELAHLPVQPQKAPKSPAWRPHLRYTHTKFPLSFHLPCSPHAGFRSPLICDPIAHFHVGVLNPGRPLESSREHLKNSDVQAQTQPIKSESLGLGPKQGISPITFHRETLQTYTKVEKHLQDVYISTT